MVPISEYGEGVVVPFSASVLQGRETIGAGMICIV